MSLLKAAQKCNHQLRSTHHCHGVRLSQPFLLRNLSTDAPDQPPQEQSSPIDPFLQSPTSPGFVYGKLFGINKNTLKTDIISMLDGSKLTLDNVKACYNKFLHPTAMLVQFASMSEYAAGIREISRRGRLYRLEKTVESEWDRTTPYNGKYIVLQGLALSTSPDDVHRFLDGCNYDSSSFQMFLRSTNADPVKMATVRFNSQIEAMSASIRKNRDFLQNNQVVVRVLQ